MRVWEHCMAFTSTSNAMNQNVERLHTRRNIEKEKIKMENKHYKFYKRNVNEDGAHMHFEINFSSLPRL